MDVLLDFLFGFPHAEVEQGQAAAAVWLGLLLVTWHSGKALVGWLRGHNDVTE